MIDDGTSEWGALCVGSPARRVFFFLASKQANWLLLPTFTQ